MFLVYSYKYYKAGRPYRNIICPIRKEVEEGKEGSGRLSVITIEIREAYS